MAFLKKRLFSKNSDLKWAPLCQNFWNLEIFKNRHFLSFLTFFESRNRRNDEKSSFFDFLKSRIFTNSTKIDDFRKFARVLRPNFRFRKFENAIFENRPWKLRDFRRFACFHTFENATSKIASKKLGRKCEFSHFRISILRNCDFRKFAQVFKA